MRVKYRYRKIGRGGLRIGDINVVAGKVFSAYPEDIPEVFMHDLKCLGPVASSPSAAPVMAALPANYDRTKDVGKGCMDKYKVLSLLHQIYNPELYLEIGVDRGVSLRLALRSAIGVDPAPKIGGNVGASEVHAVESDVFFAKDRLKGRKPDLVFIDGLHTFDQVIRDFRNVEA